MSPTRWRDCNSSGRIGYNPATGKGYNSLCCPGTPGELPFKYATRDVKSSDTGLVLDAFNPHNTQELLNYYSAARSSLNAEAVSYVEVFPGIPDMGIPPDSPPNLNAVMRGWFNSQPRFNANSLGYEYSVGRSALEFNLATWNGVSDGVFYADEASAEKYAYKNLLISPGPTPIELALANVKMLVLNVTSAYNYDDFISSAVLYEHQASWGAFSFSIPAATLGSGGGFFRIGFMMEYDRNNDANVFVPGADLSVGVQEFGFIPFISTSIYNYSLTTGVL